MPKRPDPQLVLLGKRLRELREEKGISQENFALDAGLARSYYSGIERGRRNLAAINLIRIAATLGCEVGELFPQISDLRAAVQNSRSDAGKGKK